MVSTHLKNINQIGSFPQVGVKIKKYLKPPPESWNIFLLPIQETFTILLHGGLLGLLLCARKLTSQLTHLQTGSRWQKKKRKRKIQNSQQARKCVWTFRKKKKKGQRNRIVSRYGTEGSSASHLLFALRETPLCCLQFSTQLLFGLAQLLQLRKF